MRRLLLTVIISLAGVSSLMAQDYTASYDKDGKKVLTGLIPEQALANDSAFMWFFTGVNYYKPDKELEKYLAAYRDSFTVVAFAGTWDPASQRLLPQLYKVLLSASYPQDRITVYGVDRDMKTTGNAIQQYHVTRLPTFIILHRGSEAGRIEGAVKKSVEADIIAILDNMMAKLQSNGSPQ